MSPILGFGVSFAVTLVLLGAVIATGKTRRIRPHIACVVATLGALAWTIHEAYGVGAVYDLASAGVITPIHLTLAKITTVAFLAPLVSGVSALLRPATRQVHAKIAWTVIALTIVCAVTGVVMMMLASPR